METMMVEPHPLFKVEATEPEPQDEAALQRAKREQATAITMIQIALAALSQRALVALASLFTLLTVSSAFVLWLLIPNPNTNQLIAMGMYAVFIGLINVLVLRSRK